MDGVRFANSDGAPPGYVRKGNYYVATSHARYAYPSNAPTPRIQPDPSHGLLSPAGSVSSVTAKHEIATPYRYPSPVSTHVSSSARTLTSISKGPTPSRGSKAPEPPPKTDTIAPVKEIRRLDCLDHNDVAASQGDDSKSSTIRARPIPWYLCNFNGCKYTAYIRTELEEHILATHADQVARLQSCQQPRCHHVGVHGFRTKDLLLKHVREAHSILNLHDPDSETTRKPYSPRKPPTSNLTTLRRVRWRKEPRKEPLPSDKRRDCTQATYSLSTHRSARQMPPVNVERLALITIGGADIADYITGEGQATPNRIAARSPSLEFQSESTRSITDFVKGDSVRLRDSPTKRAFCNDTTLKERSSGRLGSAHHLEPPVRPSESSTIVETEASASSMGILEESLTGKPSEAITDLHGDIRDLGRFLNDILQRTKHTANSASSRASQETRRLSMSRSPLSFASSDRSTPSFGRSSAFLPSRPRRLSTPPPLSQQLQKSVGDGDITIARQCHRSQDRGFSRGRAQSEPPIPTSSRFLDEDATGSFIHFGEPPRNQGCSASTQDTAPSSNKKRKAFTASGQHRQTFHGLDHEGLDDGDAPAGKRRRTLGPSHDGLTKDRLPCILHVGEPDEYFGHTRKYEHISQLLRHLRSHDFFACPKCFTKFADPDAEREHREQRPCVMACDRRSCKRHVSSVDARPTTCNHVHTPEQQWREIFRLQYPHDPVPDDIFAAPVTAMSNVDASDPFNAGTLAQTLDEFNYDEFLVATTHSGSDSTNLTTALTFAESGFTAGTSSTESLSREVQVLRQKAQLVDQRVSQQSQTEKDLRMTLEFVWLDYDRQAKPPNRIWQLMEKHAPEILMMSPAPRSVEPSCIPQMSPCPPPLLSTFTAADFQSLTAHNGAGIGYGSSIDSAYQSTR